MKRKVSTKSRKIDLERGTKSWVRLKCALHHFEKVFVVGSRSAHDVAKTKDKLLWH